MRSRSIFAGFLFGAALVAAQHSVIAQAPVRPGAAAGIEPVLVVGNVRKPTSLVLRREATLARAISAAGGTREQSRLVKVRVFRYLGERPQQLMFELGTVMGGGAFGQVTIKPGDIIEVSDEFGRFRLPYGIPKPIEPPGPKWDPPIIKRRSPYC
jgi:hypothetical protein